MFSRSRADGAHFHGRGQANLPFLPQLLPEKMNSVGAGEDKPIIRSQPREDSVEFLPRKGRDDLNGGKLHHFCSRFFTHGCKFTRLLTGPRDQNPFSPHPTLSPEGRGKGGGEVILIIFSHIL